MISGPVATSCWSLSLTGPARDTSGHRCECRLAGAVKAAGHSYVLLYPWSHAAGCDHADPRRGVERPRRYGAGRVEESHAVGGALGRRRNSPGTDRKTYECPAALTSADWPVRCWSLSLTGPARDTSGHRCSASDGGRVLRTKMSIDAGSLWEVLPENGSTIGNQRARSELGWKSVQRFEAQSRCWLRQAKSHSAAVAEAPSDASLRLPARLMCPNHRQPHSMSGRGRRNQPERPRASSHALGRGGRAPRQDGLRPKRSSSSTSPTAS
jgi:hypothetical protein